MKQRPFSLRSGVITAMVVCWILPIVIVVTVAGLLLNMSYQRAARMELESDATNALTQVEMVFNDAVAASKDVSYDGVVRSAYRKYLDTADSTELYRRVNEYLTQSFSRDSKYQAVFITFWDQQVNAEPYLIGSGTAGFELVRTYHSHASAIRTEMERADTSIRFLVLDGVLYEARNLLDGHFQPYATVVMMCSPQVFFLPINAVGNISNVQITLDGSTFVLTEEGVLENQTLSQTPQTECFEAVVEDHSIAFQGVPGGFNAWAETPWLRSAVVMVALMVLPLLAYVVYLFYRHVTGPMETLARANRLVMEGQRGFEIVDTAPNAEFQRLFNHFNAMSRELKSQFERSYLEQQATQQAKIKALQSQINPHFLNNTLEIINWEARIAENDRVCAMIEALSTMLDAALDRDGRTQIPLKEELGYVDAYLYIIRQRLGEGLQVERDIDDDILPQMVPRLILQPLVENAVEHDLTDRRGGRLCLRAYCRAGLMYLDIEHDGTMTEADRLSVQRVLADTGVKPTRGIRVGLRNVNQRLKLLYGEAGKLSIDETTPGTILARVTFPATKQGNP
ncbi:MAG: histidine kinase [Eubacteriales bacterium]|nr:histidine kinase [Eubacteriales bacterium]